MYAGRQVACPMFTLRLKEMVGWARWRPATVHGLLDFLFYLSVHFDLLIAAGML